MKGFNLKKILKKLLYYFFNCSHSLEESQIKGEIPPTKQLYQRTWKIAWPAVVESVLVTLISLVDTIMVSSLGTEAIAAVGITIQPRFIVLAVIWAFNMGVTAVIARRKGANDYEGANQCLKMCVVLSSGAILITASLGALFSFPLLKFAGAGIDILDQSMGYFRIMMITVVFQGVTLTINSAQRGIGNTKLSMQTNLLANVVNVMLNFFLIGGLWIFPSLGVIGAAISSAIGSFVGMAFAVQHILRRHEFLSLRSGIPLSFHLPTLVSLFRITVSAFVEQISLRFGFLIYAKMISGLGTMAFATHQICISLLSLSFAFADGFQVASSSQVGQSLGSKRPDLAQIYISVNQRLGACVATLLSLFFLTARGGLMRLFTHDPTIIATGSIIIVLIAFSVHAQIGQVITAGSLRGAGDTRYTALVSLISVSIVRPSLTFLLAYPVGFGLIGAWIAVLIDQFIRLILTLYRFRTGKWSRIQF